MIKTRIAGTAAVLTFGLAAVGGTVVAIAAPANAETGRGSSPDSSMTGTAGPAVAQAREVPDVLEDATRGPNVVLVPAPGSAATRVHVPFPQTPHNPHEGQGHKGSNEKPQPHKSQSIVIVPSPVKTGR